MNTKTGTMIIVVMLLVSAIVPVAWGGPLLVLSDRGEGVYEVRGEGFDGVGGMDLTVGYDAKTLSNPRVGQRGMIYGAMMTPNLTVPGVVRVGIVTANQRGIAGSGSIMTITFDVVGDRPGRITAFSATTISTTGARIPAQTQIVSGDAPRYSGTPAATTAEAASAAANRAASSPAASQPPPAVIAGATGMPTGLGAVTLPGDGGAPTPVPPAVPASSPAQQKPRGDAPAEPPVAVVPPEEVSVTTVTPEEPSKPPVLPSGSPPPRPAAQTPKAATQAPERKSTVHRSVMRLFEEYAGPKTPQAMTALFAQGVYPGVKQEPPIVLSDGVSKVKISVELQAGSQSPNFALRGARLVSLKLEGPVYILEVLPEARVLEATVSVLSQGGYTEIPIIVAPPLDEKTVQGSKFDEEGFALFLKVTSPAASDVTGDGRRDYRDEYVYTANYLVKTGKK